MRAHDLTGKRVVIWGTGMEGRAAAAFIHDRAAPSSLVFVDDAQGEEKGKALAQADVLIKSPGVSLYRPEIHALLATKTPVTSLLNLWLAEPHTATVVGITGSKGKSTTAALLAHVLRENNGKRIALAGNIGTPVTAIDLNEIDIAIIEISSYQAATLNEGCDIGVVTALYPEHLDWHGHVTRYYADKLNLLKQSRVTIASPQVVEAAQACGLDLTPSQLFAEAQGFHAQGTRLYDGEKPLPALDNGYLTRAHNLANVCAVLSVLRALGQDISAALEAMKSFQGLPHRQQELGEKDGLLYVNDSLSTTPHASIAAMEAYAGRPLTLIAGGFDRGIDYAPLVDYVLRRPNTAIVCMGPSGERILKALEESDAKTIALAASMEEAIAFARAHTNVGGVVLLSPAAPSYGLFKDYAERGSCFAKASGVTEG
ncbi:MAG: UDP-N-acetylmuramoyl-L-alanine--D-glutamate ligase [Bdellovibrionales bacterium]|jgi:UDP-N-acetylmuramoylalanine--D-glutamate ligase